VAGVAVVLNNLPQQGQVVGCRPSSCIWAAMFGAWIAVSGQPASELVATVLADEDVRLTGVDEAAVSQPHARHGRRRG